MTSFPLDSVSVVPVRCEAPPDHIDDPPIENPPLDPFDLVGFLEFLDETSFAELAALPYGSGVHIVINSGSGPEVQSLRPVTVEIRVDGETVWTGIIAEGQPNCASVSRCSLDGPLIDPAWQERTVEVIATGNDGAVIAWYSS